MLYVAQDLVSGSSAVDVCGSSRHFCSRVARVFVGYAHHGESPCPCLVLPTISACGRSCVFDLVRVHHPLSLTESDVSVYSACSPSLARIRRDPTANRCPRPLNVAVTALYLWPSLYPTRPSHNHPASGVASTAPQR